MGRAGGKRKQQRAPAPAFLQKAFSRGAGAFRRGTPERGGFPATLFVNEARCRIPPRGGPSFWGCGFQPRSWREGAKF